MDDVQQEVLEVILCRDSLGCEVEVIRFRFIAREITGSGLRERPGAQAWKTAMGEPVKLIDRNLYEVVSSGVLLERVS
jgi:hypothetical protein